MKTIFSIFAVIALSLTGCTVNLHGAGEAGVGYSMTGRAFTYHEADGDKEEADSQSNLDLEPALDLLLKARDAKNDGPASPSSSP